jgi:mRNA interferase MazF
MESIVESVTVCLLTSDLSDEHRILRVDVMPIAENGLHVRSQVQIEKLMTFPRRKVRGPIGLLSNREMAAVDVGLMVHLGLVTQLPAR